MSYRSLQACMSSAMPLDGVLSSAQAQNLEHILLQLYAHLLCTVAAEHGRSDLPHAAHVRTPSAVTLALLSTESYALYAVCFDSVKEEHTQLSALLVLLAGRQAKGNLTAQRGRGMQRNMKSKTKGSPVCSGNQEGHSQTCQQK